MEQNFSQSSEAIPEKRPGRQTRSRQELHQRISYVCRLLRICPTKAEVKQRIKAKYGCSARTAEMYIARARLRSRKVPRHEDQAELSRTGERRRPARRDVVAEMLANWGLSTVQ